jgi:hypothetical protein
VQTYLQKSAQLQRWVPSSFSIDFIKSIGETRPGLSTGSGAQTPPTHRTRRS